MNALQLKQRIHEYIDQADERFLRLVHSMVESEEFEKDLFSTSKDDIVTRTKKSMESRITSYNVCYTKLLRLLIYKIGKVPIHKLKRTD